MVHLSRDAISTRAHHACSWLARAACAFAGAWLLTLFATGWLAFVVLTPAAQQEQAPEDEPVELLVVLSSGQRVAGFLVESNDEGIVLRVRGAPLRLPRPEISSVTRLAPVIERYADMRASIDDDDLSTRVRLVEWLLERNKLEIARVELNDVLERDPDYAAARELDREINALEALRRRAAARAERQPEPEAPDRPGPQKLDEIPTLTEDQINLIKVYEVDVDDPPGLRVSRQTIDRLMQRYPSSPLIPTTREGRETLYAKPPEEVLSLMFRLRARDLYDEVIVEGQPRAFELFRSKVHATWLTNNCASNACHGGTEAGDLRLINRRRFRDETIYTNFLILERATLSDGTPLINYREPARSPLLHLGLMREQSLYPHPEVPSPAGVADRWRWVFRSTNDRQFRAAIDWINSMYRPRPDYPVEYPPPEPEPTTPDQEQPEPDPQPTGPPTPPPN